MKVQTFISVVKRGFQLRYFPENIAKLLRKSTFINICKLLLMILLVFMLFCLMIDRNDFYVKIAWDFDKLCIPLSGSLSFKRNPCLKPKISTSKRFHTPCPYADQACSRVNTSFIKKHKDLKIKNERKKYVFLNSE